MRGWGRGIPRALTSCVPRNPAGEAAAMETTAVTRALHSRLRREILGIYSRTNKIMMVLLTLTAPHPRLLPRFSSLPPHFSLPFCVLLCPLIPSLLSLLHQYFFLFTCPFLGLFYSLSSFLSACVSSSLPVSLLSMALSLGLSSTITGGHAQGRVLSSWSLAQASPDLSSSP